MAFFIGLLVGEAVIKRITIKGVKFICGSLSAASFQVRRQGDAGVPRIFGNMKSVKFRITLVISIKVTTQKSFYTIYLLYRNKAYFDSGTKQHNFAY